jgi:hypothetical protein
MTIKCLVDADAYADVLWWSAALASRHWRIWQPAELSDFGPFGVPLTDSHLASSPADRRCISHQTPSMVHIKSKSVLSHTTSQSLH